MLSRKIEAALKAWKNEVRHKPLVVKGCRQCCKTILAHPEKYHVNQLVKLGDYNVGRNDKMLVLPLYMAFLLKQL